MLLNADNHNNSFNMTLGRLFRDEPLRIIPSIICTDVDESIRLERAPATQSQKASS